MPDQDQDQDTNLMKRFLRSIAQGVPEKSIDPLRNPELPVPAPAQPTPEPEIVQVPEPVPAPEPVNEPAPAPAPAKAAKDKDWVQIPELKLLEPTKPFPMTRILKPNKYMIDDVNKSENPDSNIDPKVIEDLPLVEPAAQDSLSLSDDELDRLSISLSQQTKEELVAAIRGLDIHDVKIELDKKAEKIMTNILNKCREMNIDWFIAIVGGEGVGKGFYESTEILISDGTWKLAKDIKPGDKVMSPQQDGTYKFATISKNDSFFTKDSFDVIELNNQKRKLYTCCPEHNIPLNYRFIPKFKNQKGEWKQDYTKAKWEIRHFTSKELSNLKGTKFKNNTTHILMPLVESFENHTDPNIDPYLLGVYLGDGSFNKGLTIGKMKGPVMGKATNIIKPTSYYESIGKNGNKQGIYRFSLNSNLASYLKSEDLKGKTSGVKFIPQSALLSSRIFRERLLAGIIDTDGYLGGEDHESYSITTKSKQLASDLQFLIHTLGGRCHISEIWKHCQSFKPNEKRKYYNISFYLGQEMNNIPLTTNHKIRTNKSIFYLSPNRVSIDIIPSKLKDQTMYTCTIDPKESPTQWLVVRDSQSGICSVTHNSTLGLNLFALACKHAGYNPIDVLLRTLIYDEDELLRFISTVDPKEKYLPIDLDEGANVLFNRESMQVKRTYILKFFNVMRFLNAIVFIPTPNIKFLDKNVKAHRLKSIFYIPQRGVYWFYDKEQVDRMLANETSKKWYWIEPRVVGTFGVNKDLETITTLIKENYVRMFSQKVKDYLETQNPHTRNKKKQGL